jgi:hypothetical protein
MQNIIEYKGQKTEGRRRKVEDRRKLPTSDF